MDGFTEIIAIVPLVFIVAVIAAFIAYRTRNGRIGVVLAGVAVLLLVYAIVWTLLP